MINILYRTYCEIIKIKRFVPRPSRYESRQWPVTFIANFVFSFNIHGLCQSVRYQAYPLQVYSPYSVLVLYSHYYMFKRFPSPSSWFYSESDYWSRTSWDSYFVCKCKIYLIAIKWSSSGFESWWGAAIVY